MRLDKSITPTGNYTPPVTQCSKIFHYVGYICFRISPLLKFDTCLSVNNNYSDKRNLKELVVFPKITQII